MSCEKLRGEGYGPSLSRQSRIVERRGGGDDEMMTSTFDSFIRKIQKRHRTKERMNEILGTDIVLCLLMGLTRDSNESSIAVCHNVCPCCHRAGQHQPAIPAGGPINQ